jgi:hypothetical protein
MTNSRILGVLASVLVLVASAKSASAGQILNFSFTDLEGDTISGTMNGTLQSDHDTFLVSSIGPLTFDGSTVPDPLTYVGSVDVVLGVGSGFDGLGFGAVTLDGTYMDLAACDSPGCPIDGFIFAVNNSFESAYIGVPFFQALGEFGTPNEEFNAVGWSASLASSTPAPSTPEPGSLVLVLVALLVTMVRKRKAIILAIQTTR